MPLKRERKSIHSRSKLNRYPDGSELLRPGIEGFSSERNSDGEQGRLILFRGTKLSTAEWTCDDYSVDGKSTRRQVDFPPLSSTERDHPVSSGAPAALPSKQPLADAHFFLPRIGSGICGIKVSHRSARLRKGRAHRASAGTGLRLALFPSVSRYDGSICSRTGRHRELSGLRRSIAI